MYQVTIKEAQSINPIPDSRSCNPPENLGELSDSRERRQSFAEKWSQIVRELLDGSRLINQQRQDKKTCQIKCLISGVTLVTIDHVRISTRDISAE